MSYIVFGLGILLTAVGSLAIYAGFDIIQVERGWTEVISGATAVTGGIVTISLALVLHRIESIAKLFVTPTVAPAQHAASAPLAAAEPPFMVPPAVEPIHVPAESEPAQIPAIPAPALAPALAPNISFRRPAKPPVWSQSLFPSAVSQTAEKETVHEEMSHPPAVSTEEPVNLPLTAAPVGLVETYLPEPLPELDISPQATSSASLLDEMWKRVSDEIEKPIFATHTPNPMFPRTETQTPPTQSAHDEFEALIEAEARSSLSPKRHDDPGYEDADALWQPHSGSSDRDAQMGFLDPVSQASAFPLQPTLVEQLSAASHEESEPPRISHGPAEDKNVKSQPAVVGRYEAEGTAYLMFSDGSIEAQSEAGIFYFASMAELKAFIESKQAAAS